MEADSDAGGYRPGSLSELMSFVDHTLIRPEMTRSEVADGIEAACSLGTAAVVVRPWEVAWAKSLIADRGPLVCTSISFPHGAGATVAKVRETLAAIESGADEVDVVMNVGAFRSGLVDFVLDDLSAVVKAASPRTVKVIIETAYLSRDEVVAAANLVSASGAAYVKNGTGYSPRGATTDETRSLRQIVPASVLVKAAGGIRTLASMLALIDAGAARIGTSSTVAIADEWRATASSPEQGDS